MSEPTSKASLYRKIAAIAASIEMVSKDGYNPQLKYKYATPATIMEAVKPLLANHHLAIVPTVNAIVKESTGSKTQSGAEKVITRVEMTYLILDGDSGESLACTWAGEGEDWSDKGIAKAQTIALRTFLIQLFQIPSGDDDPDVGQVQPQQRGATYAPPQPQRPAPAKPPEKPAAASNGAPQPKTHEDWVTALRTAWNEEEAYGGTVPEKVNLDDLTVATSLSIDDIKALGKKSKARLIELRKQHATA